MVVSFCSMLIVQEVLLFTTPFHRDDISCLKIDISLWPMAYRYYRCVCVAFHVPVSVVALGR